MLDRDWVTGFLCPHCDTTLPSEGKYPYIQHTELGLGSLVLRAVALSAKLVSTTEFRASPGRAPLGVTLRLVSAVCGRGHSMG